MSKIIVITDTAACLPDSVLSSLPIKLVPMTVVFGDQTYREGIDMQSDELYALLERGEIPTTSQPSPGDFLQVMQPLVESGHQVLAVLVSSKVSGTVQSARIAAEMLPTGAVTVFDSESFAMGTGLLAIAAAQAAIQGQAIDQIVQQLEQQRAETTTLAAVPTLKFLQKSGRVNLAQALLGQLLNLKPILRAEQGLVNVAEKARSWPAAVRLLVDMAKDWAGEHAAVVAVQHGGDLAAAEELLATLERELSVKQSYVCVFTASLAVHGGPGMLGVVVQRLS